MIALVFILFVLWVGFFAGTSFSKPGQLSVGDVLILLLQLILLLAVIMRDDQFPRAQQGRSKQNGVLSLFGHWGSPQ